jgi:hypothetical protein
MYDKFIDKILLQVQDKMISRILHEFIWLYEIDTIDKTADNLANKIEDSLFCSILDLMFI